MIGDDDPYVYPGTKTLRNCLGITDARELDRIERRLVTDRIAEGAPSGIFDLLHFCAIHRHLFQDVYDWAGQLRTVEINKGGHQFQFRQYIQTGMGDVHRRLRAARFLRGLSPAEFAREAAVIIGDVNYVHPFREGNGRTQAQYLQQLAAQAGYDIDLTRIQPKSWIEASKASFATDYSLMTDAISKAMAGAYKPEL
ncbi:MAG: cell filamentation protein [Alphaproteobacteria bacterium]|nr:cell filamentation protein [Alphaproteobacteria bacterium]